MKIETNFGAPVARLAAWSALISWVFAGLAIIAAVVLWFHAKTMALEIQEVSGQLAQVEARRDELGPQPVLPSAAEFDTLKRRVDTINSLSITRGRRLLPLFALLEDLLPRDAWLVSMHHKAREGELVLIAESRNAEELTRFLLNLEKSARFAEVLLLRQTPLGTNGQRTVRFELRLRERS